MKKRLMKGVLCLMLMLSLGANALAEGRSYAVQLENGALLVDAQGNDLAPMGTYSLLFELYGLPEDGVQLYAGEKQGDPLRGYALIDAQGNALTGFDYRALEYADGSIIFMENERWGVMDLTGSVLIEPKYTSVLSAGEGRFLATRTDLYDDSPDIVYLVEVNGAEQATDARIADAMYRAADDLYAAASADNGLYGYLNAEGEWVIEPRYLWAGMFEDGIAQAAMRGGAGLIDMQGHWVIEPKYEFVYGGANGEMISAGSDNQVSVIHPETYEVVAQMEGQTVRGFMPAMLASAEAQYIHGQMAENSSLLIVKENGALLMGADGSKTELFEGAESIFQAHDGLDQLIVRMGNYGTESVYLYGMDGVQLAGPYQQISLLGEQDGRVYYCYAKYETREVRYPELGMSLLDEVPGTRVCGLLSQDGGELFETKAEYFTYLGEDRILIQQEGGAAMANFSGEIIRAFETPDTERE